MLMILKMITFFEDISAKKQHWVDRLINLNDFLNLVFSIQYYKSIIYYLSLSG
jgi:hypothetical protein